MIYKNISTGEKVSAKQMRVPQTLFSTTDPICLEKGDWLTQDSEGHFSKIVDSFFQVNYEKIEEITRDPEPEKDKEIDEWDHWHTDDIICPHCGANYRGADFLADCGEEDRDQEDEWECDTCGEKFMMQMETTVTFTTWKMEGEDE